MSLPWYVLPDHAADLPDPLPTRAPLPAQYIHNALPRLAPVIRGDIRNGRANSRRARLAFAQLAEALPVGLLPSRREVESGVRWLEREVWGNAHS
ncbi:hypothetical protein [Microbacterium sp. RU33B]|uniref:hypothetical protein n=1 Tax=Microbacterium sp. RU33B TaxID=1907390 RepID=UPI0009679A2B|nr:hypothetical protein [Microbacterium sp. RU33B]SIT73636.1 hypothetical protein SAMN05880545_1249 [Microbacterium sp. RU33B]